MSTTAVRPLAPERFHVSPNGASRLVQEAVRRWHLLSLDAPTVAAVWMLTFSAAQPWQVRLPQAAALALAVWLFYVGDRLLDAARAPQNRLEARHRFHATHRRRFVAVAVAALPVLLSLVVWLPTGVRAGWCWLLLPMVCYVAAVHLWPVRRLPKELAVGLMFAAATAMPAFVETTHHHLHLFCIAALFAALCWLNCVAIARWESASRWSRSARSTAWGALYLPKLCGVLAVLGCLLLPLLGGVAGACAVSALLLLLLEHNSRHLEAVTLRALADAALLTPLLLLLRW